MTSSHPRKRVKATFHLTISMGGQRATGKIQRNNYHHGSCRPSLTGKTMSVFLILSQRTHQNVKNPWVKSNLKIIILMDGKLLKMRDSRVNQCRSPLNGIKRILKAQLKDWFTSMDHFLRLHTTARSVL